MPRFDTSKTVEPGGARNFHTIHFSKETLAFGVHCGIAVTMTVFFAGSKSAKASGSGLRVVHIRIEI